MLNDAELESVGVTVEANLDHFLHGSRGFTFPPETVFPGLVDTFPGNDGFLDGFKGRVDETECGVSLGVGGDDGGEEAVRAIRGDGRQEGVCDVDALIGRSGHG
jgi:hypothetical protein